MGIVALLDASPLFAGVRYIPTARQQARALNFIIGDWRSCIIYVRKTLAMAARMAHGRRMFDLIMMPSRGPLITPTNFMPTVPCLQTLLMVWCGLHLTAAVFGCFSVIKQI